MLSNPIRMAIAVKLFVLLCRNTPERQLASSGPNVSCPNLGFEKLLLDSGDEMTQNKPRPIGEILAELLAKYLASHPASILDVAQEKRTPEIAAQQHLELATTQKNT